jgi:hypothetical protein
MTAPQSDEMNDPNIDTVAPSEGSSAGGGEVTIEGSLLADVAKVTFDNIQVDPTSKTESVVKCISPPHNPGPVDVFVTNSDGTTKSNTLPYRYV